jgi:hypothetical protein
MVGACPGLCALRLVPGHVSGQGKEFQIVELEGRFAVNRRQSAVGVTPLALFDCLSRRFEQFSRGD